MKRIEEWLKEQIGLDPASVGPDLVARAIQRRCDDLKIVDEGDYLALLHTSEEERQLLIENSVVPETWFFRDLGPFQYLQTWVKNWRGAGKLRIASAPCSHGEEPYSIAISLLEAGLEPYQFTIDAFDVSLHALQQAKNGLYRPISFRAEIPNKDKYFEPTSEGMELRQSVRSIVNFEWGNLLDPSFGLNRDDYHIFFCRNLFIYLDVPSRKRVIETIERMLAPDGLLFLGAVESIQAITTQFESLRAPNAFAFKRREYLNQAVASEEHKVKPVANTRQVALLKEKNLYQRREQRSSKRAVLPVRKNRLEHARELSDQGQLKEALSIVDDYINNERPNAEAYYLYGLLQQALGEPKQAEMSYQKALFLQPDHEGALAQIALLRDQGGDPAGAERFRRRLQRIREPHFTMKGSTV